MRPTLDNRSGALAADPGAAARIPPLETGNLAAHPGPLRPPTGTPTARFGPKTWAVTAPAAPPSAP